MTPKISQQLVPQNKKKIGRKAKIATIILTLALVGIIPVFILNFLARPIQGKITVKEKTQNTSFDTSNEQKKFSGEYFSFSVPGIHEEKAHQLSKEGPVLETILLTLTATGGDKVAVTVENRGNEGLEASPSFKMRETNEKMYQKETFSENDLKGCIFSTREPVFEETAFFSKENKVVIISVTGAFSGENLRERLIKILRSIHWKEG